MRRPHWATKVIAATAITLLISLFYGMWQIKEEFFDRPIGQVHTLVTLPKATSAKTLSHILLEKHVISSPRTFIFLLKYQHLSHLLKSGTYQIEAGDTVWSLLEKMLKGRVYMVSLKIIEGTRWCDCLKAWEHSSEFRFNQNMLNGLRQNFPFYEGAFYSSTYRQAYGESILPVLQLAQDTLFKRLQEVWATRDSGLPYQTPLELLIAASIIEKESALETERRLISGVMVNRLRLNMPLQMDPTVAYGLSACEHVMLKGGDTKIDTPYNTYLHLGLPPTPISMVSDSALMAAAHPEKTAFLYFVANGHGQHTFSVNYQQQLKAIQQLREAHAQ